MSDVSRKVVPDKGSLNRERLATKALKFPSCTRKFCFFHLNWNVESEECITERHDDRYGGGVPPKLKTNTGRKKNGYLKNNPVFDWQPVKCREQWSNMLMLCSREKQRLLRGFELFATCTSDHS